MYLYKIYVHNKLIERTIFICMNTSSQHQKSMINTIIDGIAGIFLPIVSLLSAAGILKGIIAVLIATDVLIKESDNYLVLNAMADSLFYFLPMLLAYTSAKKFGANPLLLLSLLQVFFLYPSLNHILESGQTVEFFSYSFKRCYIPF